MRRIRATVMALAGFMGSKLIAIPVSSPFVPNGIFPCPAGTGGSIPWTDQQRTQPPGGSREAHHILHQLGPQVKTSAPGVPESALPRLHDEPAQQIVLHLLV